MSVHSKKKTAKPAKGKNGGIIAVNRRARYDYEISETIECGLVLAGTEVKSLREGQANIAEAWAGPKEGELFLLNANITEYKNAAHFNHEPRRPRKLLLKRKERNKLFGLTQTKGYTLVPLSLYFNERGKAKLSLGVAKGKKLHDKRQSEKDRQWGRDKARLMSHRDL